MRIAFFITSLPEPHRKTGGVEAHVHRLAERLAGRGHELVMFTFSPPLENSAYRHVQLQPAGLRDRKIARLTVVPALLNRITPDADVLHLHGDDWFYFRRTLPTVRTFYGSALWEARTAVRLRRRARCTAIFAGEILASRLANSAYDIAPGTGRAFATRGTLPPAVEPTPGEGAKAKRPTVLFVGTWTGRKRGSLLAERFRREVLPVIPDAELVMVSDRADPAPWIRHVPHPSDAEVTALMREAWVMCLPSTYEGFGIPYAEAMAAGTPVIATPNPGSRYVLDEGRAGIITSDAALGRDLVRVLQSPELRRDLAARGRERVLEFAWDRVLDLHEAAYAEASERWTRTRA